MVGATLAVVVGGVKRILADITVGNGHQQQDAAVDVPMMPTAVAATVVRIISLR
jgi:hypothetical protein